MKEEENFVRGKKECMSELPPKNRVHEREGRCVPRCLPRHVSSRKTKYGRVMAAECGKPQQDHGGDVRSWECLPDECSAARCRAAKGPGLAWGCLIICSDRLRIQSSGTSLL